MKKNLKIATTLLLLFIVSGCATTGQANKMMDSWMGVHKDDLIAAWGFPTQIIADGTEGEIFVYSQQRNVGMLIPGTTIFTSSPRSAQRVFWVNTNGYIYRWSWRGI